MVTVSDGSVTPYSMRLLGRFLLDDGDGQPVAVPHDGARLLAYLALIGGQEVRPRVVSALWPDEPFAVGAKRLRTVLWRVGKAAPAALVTCDGRVFLSQDVAVDVASVSALAVELADGNLAVPALSGPDVISVLSEDLLPGWDEEWLAVRAEAWRQTRVYALQTLAKAFTTEESFAEATAAALAAVDADPLCESSQRTLMLVHAAAGNPARAVRQYESYADLLRREMDMGPSDELRSLAAACA